ncbi:hypothetical protein V8J82_10760 [Gymnodinialimonas sp. 2305UL16-5]|uniref:hypothetical protein n=1 Tax=Gymnodinialimonas mytili TaxID=3126503 RepID=UPI0030A62B44
MRLAATRSLLLAAVFWGGTAASAIPEAPRVGAVIGQTAIYAQLYAEICVETETQDAAQELMREEGMVEDPETGTFFHQHYDLSFNPSGKRCAMVFRSEEAPETVTAALSDALAAQVDERMTELQIDPRPGNDGLYILTSREVDW